MIVIPLTAVILSTLRDLFLILFLALGSAWFALDIIRRLRNQPVQSSVAPAVPVPTPAVATIPSRSAEPTTITPSNGIPPEHLAVIAATVHHLFRGRARLTGVSHTKAHDSRWAHEGRRDIFISHRIR